MAGALHIKIRLLSSAAQISGQLHFVLSSELNLLGIAGMHTRRLRAVDWLRVRKTCRTSGGTWNADRRSRQEEIKNACSSRLLRSSFHLKSQVCHVPRYRAAAATGCSQSTQRTHTPSYLPDSLKIILANEILRDYSVSMAATVHRWRKSVANEFHVLSHANNMRRNSPSRSPTTAFHARKQRHHVFILF